MPTFIRSGRWLLLAALPCLALRCSTPYCDLCEPPCQGKQQGTLSLRPGSLTWLPTPAPDSLRFRNSNGYRAVLARVTTPAAPDSVNLPAAANPILNYQEEALNSPYGSCAPYLRARRVYQYYRGQSLNLDLRFNVFKNLYALGSSAPSLLTQAVADTLPDIAVVSFNEQYFGEFPVAARPYRQPRSTPYNSTTVYLDSVRLAGRTFLGVYQCTRNAYGAAVQPQRFYFQPGQGLVGFTYSNNEQWARY